MLRLRTNIEKSFLDIDNPNDTLDFVTSLKKSINSFLNENDEQLIKNVNITYGASKKTSDQKSEEYNGAKGFVTLLKKSLSAGDEGYFSGKRNRWTITVFDNDNNKNNFKYFDNHLKINFKCKTMKERETLKTIIFVLLNFYKHLLQCSICDLDYIEDVEIIEDELFEFNVYIYARTSISFKRYDTQELFKKDEYDYNQEQDIDDELDPGFNDHTF